VLAALGDWQSSLDTLLPLLAEPELAENPLQRASVLSNAGFAASQLGDHELAERVFAEAIGLSRANGQRELSLIVLVNQAWVSLARGRPREAILELADAVTEFPEALEQALDMAEVAVIAGLALVELGRDDDAQVAEAYATAAVAAAPRASTRTCSSRR
jgi:tetratricopeptide (TPR) repeat protein